MGRGNHRNCEICGLQEKNFAKGTLFFARFPLDESRCREWLKAVGNEELVHLPIEKLNQLRYVCENHFRKRDFTKNRRHLKKRAIPQLNLKATPLTDDQLTNFPQHMWWKNKKKEPASEDKPATHKQKENIPAIQPQTFAVPEAVPSTSKEKTFVISQDVSAENLPKSSTTSLPKDLQGTQGKKGTKRKLEESLDTMMPQETVQTSHQNQNVLKELNPNVAVPEAVPSTSKEKTFVISQNVSAENLPKSSTTSLPKDLQGTQGKKGTKRKLEESLDTMMPQETVQTSHQNQNVLKELNPNVAVPEAVPSTSKEKTFVISQNVSAENLPKSSTTSLPKDLQGTQGKKGTKRKLEESLDTMMPQETVQTSHQNQNVLKELNPNVAVPEAVPSTSKEKTFVISQNVSAENLPKSSTTSLPKDLQGTQGKKGTKRKLEESLDLTPRKRKLLAQLQKTKCNLASLRKSAQLIEKIESPLFKEMVSSAIKNQKRKPKGRRWNTKNKISALAIFKRSPKTYRYLQQLIPLPSVKTLHNVLKKVPMEPGINNAVIENLKNISPKKNALDKCCALLFDEIALKRRLIYNVATDKVEGYQDLGNTMGAESGRSGELADHALVFMLQGLRAKFKQPVAFYFVKGTISSQQLAVIIRQIINTVEETGFKVLTTVCDQGPTNMGALKLLKEWSPPTPDTERSQNSFVVDDKEIFIIYDVPHLFKSIRNNFLNYGELSMNGKKAKWCHLMKVEEKNRQLLYLSKISPTHVQPKYKAKMKVKYAAQMLSNTVAAVLKLLAQAEQDPTQADEMMQTATIVQELDRLFDCTNGPASPEDVKKGIRQNVSQKTDHLKTWADFRKKLETVKFQKPGVTAKNVRCIQGYLITLCSLRDLWHKVRGLGFKYLNLRQLNQDALENLFGVIRQHSPTNRNPTCSSFIAALKTFIVSGLTAIHNRGFNCEKDDQSLLTDFHNLIFEEPLHEEKNRKEKPSHESKSAVIISEPNQDIPVLNIPDDFEFSEIEADLTEVEEQPVVYLSGYIASRILKNHHCIECKNCLCIEDPGEDPIYSYIKLREWWTDKNSLTYPTIGLCRLVETAAKAFEKDIIKCFHYLNICKLTVTVFMMACDTRFVQCLLHGNELINTIYVNLALLLIRRQCARQNKSLSMEEEGLADAIKIAQQRGIAK